MRSALSFLAAVLFAACASAQTAADPASDAPESPPALAAGMKLPVSYREALATWRTVDEVNAWIGARFEYDFRRAARWSPASGG